MNESLPDLIYNGILLCLNIQLIIIGFIKIVSKDRRSIILGAFCLFLATAFIYNLYWEFFKTSAFYSILLSNYKSFFLGPLLYLYISLLKEKETHKKLIHFHLAFPFIFFWLSFALTIFWIHWWSGPSYDVGHLSCWKLTSRHRGCIFCFMTS